MWTTLVAFGIAASTTLLNCSENRSSPASGKARGEYAIPSSAAPAPGNSGGGTLIGNGEDGSDGSSFSQSSWPGPPPDTNMLVEFIQVQGAVYDDYWLVAVDSWSGSALAWHGDPANNTTDTAGNTIVQFDDYIAWTAGMVPIVDEMDPNFGNYVAAYTWGTGQPSVDPALTVDFQTAVADALVNGEPPSQWEASNAPVISFTNTISPQALLCSEPDFSGDDAGCDQVMTADVRTFLVETESELDDLPEVPYTKFVTRTPSRTGIRARRLPLSEPAPLPVNTDHQPPPRFVVPTPNQGTPLPTAGTGTGGSTTPGQPNQSTTTGLMQLAFVTLAAGQALNNWANTLGPPNPSLRMTVPQQSTTVSTGGGSTSPLEMFVTIAGSNASATKPSNVPWFSCGGPPPTNYFGPPPSSVTDADMAGCTYWTPWGRQRLMPGWYDALKSRCLPPFTGPACPDAGVSDGGGSSDAGMDSGMDSGGPGGDAGAIPDAGPWGCAQVVQQYGAQWWNGPNFQTVMRESGFWDQYQYNYTHGIFCTMLVYRMITGTQICPADLTINCYGVGRGLRRLVFGTIAGLVVYWATGNFPTQLLPNHGSSGDGGRSPTPAGAEAGATDH
jgi:hypothetical protein